MYLTLQSAQKTLNNRVNLAHDVLAMSVVGRPIERGIAMEEIWKDVEGYEGLYKINQHGEILSFKGKIRKHRKSSTGYMMIDLWKNNKPFATSIHRLLAIAFLNKENGKNFVNHKNSNRLDNRIENLEWVTKHENNMYQIKQKRNTESKYKGISKTRNKKKWFARVMINKKQIHLGTFDLEIDAAKAYNEGAKKYFGNFASLNIINTCDGYTV